MFSNQNFSPELWKVLSEKPNRELLYIGSYTLTFQEDGIKVDLAKWNIEFLQFDTIENIRLSNPLDVFAMKFDEITTRKTKKDFVDIYELCQHFSFHEGYKHYNKLFPYSKNSSIILSAFGEIEEADNTKMPQLFRDYNWEIVKEKLTKYAKKYFL